MRAYILAGGHGSRLSPDKGFLTVGGVSIAERVYAAVAPLAEEVVLVGDSGPRRPLDLRVIVEEAIGSGPLAALCVALADAHPRAALIVPWDAPFITTPALQYLQQRTGEAEAVVPRRGEWIEPLFAVYGPRCCAAARAALDAGRRRVVSFYDQVTVRWVGEQELAPFGEWGRLFLNVNTPADLIRAREMAGESHGGYP